MNSPLPPHHIKSFVRREGRFTPRQRTALTQLSNEYLLPADQGLLDMATVFGREAPVLLEIGFGMGQALLHMARTFPEKNVIGIEVYRPGAGALLAELSAQGINNVRIFLHDAASVLPLCIPDGSLHAIHIFFPDPWPKTRHHKRRLIQIPFVELLVRKLVSGGYIHLATDWEDYAHHMLHTLLAVPGLTNTAHPFAPNRGDRPITKYEQRGTRLGHGVWDLKFTKSS